MKYLKYFWATILWGIIGLVVLVSNMFFSRPIGGLSYLCLWFVFIIESTFNGLRDYDEDRRYEEDGNNK